MEAARSDSHSRASYEILRIVNRGGMGEIALAKVIGKNGFEKLVVLKRLREDAEREDHRAMFDIEAELMSRIEHPNIVQVFDQPVVDNVPYLAMAYIRGRNLDQLIRRSRAENIEISPVLALTIISEVLRGLAFIHRLKDDRGKALGIVHQDITPSNILVSFFGEVKITDFGIAYVTSRDGGLRSGVLKGKPRYVAPEVLAGKRVNNRVDIYGVGLVLYELLKKRPLFARKKVQDTLSAVAKNELPDFAVDLPQVPTSVHTIIKKALSKDPNERYRTAEDLNIAISRELNAMGGPISHTHLGNYLRDQFKGDRDAPEVDADVDLDNISMSIFPPVYKSPDLDQTLSELDRLLGGEGSSDVFTLPAEIERELAGMVDMEPFEALTPIPEFALDPTHEDSFLRGAGVDPRPNSRFSGNVDTEPTPVLSGLIPPIPRAPSSSEHSLRDLSSRRRPASAVTDRLALEAMAKEKSSESLKPIPLSLKQRTESLAEDFDERPSRRGSVTGEYSFAPAQRSIEEGTDSLKPERNEDTMSVDLVKNSSGWRHSIADEISDSNLPTPELVEEETQRPSTVAKNSRAKAVIFAIGLLLGLLVGTGVAALIVLGMSK